MSYNIDTLISVAENEIGYLEKKSNADLESKTGNAGSANYTKYWRDLCPSLQGNAWCNAFVNWCFVKAFGTADAKKLLCCSAFSYYTPTSSGYFKSKGQWHTSNPQRGDVIYYKNASRICHVGIVYKVDSSYVYTIEGNTSGGSGLVANGGGVASKKYSRSSSYIAGYGRPNYGAQATAQTPSESAQKAADSTQTTAGESIKVGSYVQVTATQLNIRAGAGTQYKVLGVLNRYHRFTVREVNGNWVKCCVYPDNKPGVAVTGWVSKSYLAKG